jgi:ankyrin repeat protein
MTKGRQMDRKEKTTIIIIAATLVITFAGYFVFDWYTCYDVFIRAVKDGDLAKVKKMVKSKPYLVNKKDKFKFIPLFFAIEKGWTDISIFLIENGADKNYEVGETQWHLSKRDSGIGPKYNPVDSKRWHLSRTRDVYPIMIPNFRYPDGTALHAAVLYDHKLLPYLLKKGAKVNEKSKEMGYTPLHYAARFGMCDIAKILIDAGADVNSQDINGQTPLTHAVEVNNKEMTEFLKKNGTR